MNREGGEEGTENGVSNHRRREAQEHRSSGSEAGSGAVVGCGPHQGRTCAQREGGQDPAGTELRPIEDAQQRAPKKYFF